MNGLTYSLKTVVRGRKRSILLMVLVFLVSVLLYIGCSLKWESDRRVSEASSSFRIMGLIGEENQQVDLWEEEYQFLKSLDYIQMEEPMILSASSSEIHGEANPRTGIAYKTTCAYSQTEEPGFLFTEEQSVFTFRYVGDGYGEYLSTLAGAEDPEIEKTDTPMLIHDYSSNQEAFEMGEVYIAYGRGVPFLTAIEIYDFAQPGYCGVEKETEQSDYWEEICSIVNATYFPFTVMSVKSPGNLYEFHENLAVIQEGEGFTEATYAEGQKICFISSKLARLNDLQVGDEIPLFFYESDYMMGYRMNQAGSMNPESTKALHEYVSEDTFQIAGIYSFVATAEEMLEFDLNERTIIIPESALASFFDEKVISDYRVGKRIEELQYVTINFKPEDMDRFMKDRSRLVSLQVQLYDQGYSQVKNSLKSFQELANILLSVGIICAVLAGCFVVYFEARARGTEQKVYCALGFNRKQILMRFVLSMALICLPGLIGGCVCGYIADSAIIEVMNQEQEFTHFYEGITSMLQ